MRPTFLSAGDARLVPIEEDDGARLASMPWRLLPTGAPGDGVALVVLGPGNALLGLVRLEAVDWVERRATLALRWGAGPALVASVLAAVLRYADQELRLDRIEARVIADDGPWASLLEGSGLAREGATPGAPGTTVLIHSKAFARRAA